jgi:predicted transcriptional regulator
MDQAAIQSALAQLANLKAFAEKSKIPRRTLERIKAGGEYRANDTTLRLIDQALRRFKPAMKEQA